MPKDRAVLAPELTEKVLHHFHYLALERSGSFGNARLARNCVEAVMNTQATRRAVQP